MALTQTLGLLVAAAVAAGPTESHDGVLQDMPQRVQSLVDRMNGRHDLPPSQVTAAGNELIRLGFPALRHGALELIVSEDPASRLCGQCVLHAIVSQEFGSGTGDRGNLESPDPVHEIWMKLGDYRYDMAESDRQACYERWTNWVATVDALASRPNVNRLRPPRVDEPKGP